MENNNRNLHTYDRPANNDAFFLWLNWFNQQETVYEAIRALSRGDLNCLGVTGDEGKLVGCIALEDIQEIFRTKQRQMLSASLHEFTTYMRSRHTQAVRTPMIHRSSQASLAIHRLIGVPQKAVWIVDSKDRPTGIINVTDVFSVLS